MSDDSRPADSRVLTQEERDAAEQFLRAFYAPDDGRLGWTDFAASNTRRLRAAAWAALTPLFDELAALRAQGAALRVDRHTRDEIRAINQAAAVLDSVLAVSYDEQRELASTLFAIAGNPMPDAARTARPAVDPLAEAGATGPCAAHTPDSRFYCTRPASHDGEHVALGSSGTEWARWSSPAPERAP